MLASPRGICGPPVERTAALDKHLSPAELAEREGVPLDTVFQWNRKGTGPRYMRIGRHVRYRLADVVAWEDSRLVDARAS